ncbi:MAG TPA: tRNA uridine-5-carboxymethylaminomethyl(34) synthesis GTPase MnmE [Syntrophomonadaceae bacterium]|nr:tRNA uridine-5-carboxymethylaminomethyl(34) synthesis GTPase MnmE [Syntrophomonadaceae bacterium]
MNPFKNEDIIAAISTPLGEGAISIIRISGKGSLELVGRVFKPRRKSLAFEEIPTHKMTLGYIVDKEGQSLDEVLICPMKAPYTYTKEDIVEIYCHGGVMAVQRVFDLILSMGARVAEPGEFTKRAFLNGRIDLAQAEAVLDIIRSRSQMGVDIALKQLSGRLSGVVESLREELKGILVEVEAEIDFPDDVEASEKDERAEKIRGMIAKIEAIIGSADVGRIYREGLAAVLVGKPNTGKSTLLNRLLGEQRAIVTDIPGTTRDIIEESINIKGIPLRLLDTAGVRMNAGTVERLGIEKTKEAVERADIVIALFDRTSPLQEDDRMVMEIIKGKRSIVLLNKVDVPDKKLDKKDIKDFVGDVPVIEISACSGWGLEELKNAVVEIVGVQRVTGEAVMITNARHKAALERTRKSLKNALRAFEIGVPLDCIAVDLWEAWDCLGEITGATVNDEIIDQIFENFCIGK